MTAVFIIVLFLLIYAVVMFSTSQWVTVILLWLVLSVLVTVIWIQSSTIGRVTDENSTAKRNYPTESFTEPRSNIEDT